jgi:IS605 OrfB family transposase
MIKAHKIRLHPSPEQATSFAKAAGTARFVWNWALADKKLRQANKGLHRRKLGSKNREKARRQVARLHYRIPCLRDDVLHKLTTRLTQCYGMIGIEDLKGLLKNRKLARSFSDAASGKLLSLLTSKMERRGGQVVKVDRFFPSSKTCHCCGWKWEDMQLSDRFSSARTRTVPILNLLKIGTITPRCLSWLKPCP